jgi:hypothetical protein
MPRETSFDATIETIFPILFFLTLKEIDLKDISSTNIHNDLSCQCTFAEKYLNFFTSRGAACRRADFPSNKLIGNPCPYFGPGTVLTNPLNLFMPRD